MMKFLTSLGGGSGVAAAAAVGAVIVGGVAWVQFGNRAVETPAALVAPEPATTPAPSADKPQEQAAQSVPDQAQAPTEAAPTVEAADPVETPAPPAPRFDEVRRENDGTTVIAGRAVPGSVVQILQDGVEIATATADASGQFATLAFVTPDGNGHVLTLLQTVDGEDIASVEQIILAPVSPPVVVAEVAQEPTTEPVEVAQAPTETEVTEGGEPTEAAGARETADGATVADSSPDPVQETAQVTEEASVAQTRQAPDAVVEAVVAGVEAAAPETVAPRVESTAAVQVTTEAPAPKADPVVAEAGPVTEEQPVETASVASVEMTVTPLPADAPDVEPPQPVVPPVEVAVLKATEDGVELLNPASPEVMDTVAIDTISYSSTGDVQLSGRAQADARTVRVYLDNAAIVNLSVDAQGRWRGDLPDVDEGIYTLRVDEVDEDGSVTSRVETPFKREAPAVLEAASAENNGPIKAITVQKGATLWAIARERYGSGDLYVRVFEANKSAIRDPDLIYPGQVFDLPD